MASYMNLGDLESRLFCTVKRGVYFFDYILAVLGADWTQFCTSLEWDLLFVTVADSGDGAIYLIKESFLSDDIPVVGLVFAGSLGVFFI